MKSEEVKFPGITYPTTRETIAKELNLRSSTVRKMLRPFNLKPREHLSPLVIKKFREMYIDGD